MLTLAQVKSSSVANVAGVNVADPQFIQLVNDAVQQLVDIGNWWGTVRAMRGACANGRVVWPDGVESVLAVKSHGTPLTVRNMWYDFVPFCGEFIDDVMRRRRDDRRDGVVRFSGTLPVFYPPDSTNPFAVQATADNPADYGKTITIYGRDTNGQDVVALRPDGSTQRGVVLTLAAIAPFTTQVFSEISAVVKDITIANVRLWVYDPTNLLNIIAGIYSGATTNPEYLYSNITGLGTQEIEALVQFGFRPVSQDSDILTIDCLDAIKCQVQSIKARDAGDVEKSLFYEKMAIRRLNMQLRSRFPQEQFALAFRPFGNDTLQRQKIGTMI